MVGIFIIYFIGKKYYELAVKYNQKKWLFAFLGFVVYYASAIVMVIFLLIIDGILGLNINFENKFFTGVLELGVGFTGVIVTYNLLKKKWEREYPIEEDELQDIGKNASS